MKHVWVALQYVMVDIEPNPDNPDELRWSVTEAADELARDEAVVGCWVCEEMLTPHTYNTECPGPPNGGTPQN